MKKLRTVALLGREPGLRVLQDVLIDNPLVELAAVYTHPNLPRKEGGGPRPELARYQALCAAGGVPLHCLDVAQAKGLDQMLPEHRADLLLVLSWRSILTAAMLAQARFAINLHRGALPDYAGAEPVRRAIEAGEARVAITAHHMVEEVDAGRVAATVWMDIAPCPPTLSAAEYAEQVKERLLPLYAPLARLAIASVAA
ncbi:hypothetical protein MTBLM5_140028 [Magnetospirillum sp. LM-5]|uniref:formyltransferase family protein n=1 Tax=Magnetospirillum sp. LM-5 TaxID=2681466 RepID=UPI00138418AA|nr:formyltransferase family protein [Magnetospirillum sp. LM-5]CAA7614710.1 hypothetical protein MTBLM5_140028 [Magnetospirillum sp. LM-5]